MITPHDENLLVYKIIYESAVWFVKNILSQTKRHFGKFCKDFKQTKQKFDQKSPLPTPGTYFHH